MTTPHRAKSDENDDDEWRKFAVFARFCDKDDDKDDKNNREMILTFIIPAVHIAEYAADSANAAHTKRLFPQIPPMLLAICSQNRH